MATKVNVPLNERSLDVVRRSKDDLTKILLSKYNCDVSISGVDFDDGAAASQPSRPSVGPERRFEVTLKSGVVVSVWKGDLAHFAADVVVNSANENLLHIGGLALALSKAGGPRIDRDSRDYVRNHGAVHTGSAVIMDAGALPCRKIIHAVGPRLHNHYSQTELSTAERLLDQTVCSIIDLVEKDGLHTVAIPAISSGIFNFPLPSCAKTIVRALNHARFVKEILLVNIDEPTVRAMERACKEELDKDQHTWGAPSRMKANAKITTGSGHFGNVRVTVKRGYIEDQQTDVIVNSTSRKSWNVGPISKAILRKAGYGMEKELQKASSDELVIITDAFRLKCKKVFHILWPVDQEPLHMFMPAVLQCLEIASASHSSISFPAIGTGIQGFGKRDVARFMLNAVAEFATDQRKKLDVCFVIHPSEEDTFKAFEEEMSGAQQMAPRQGRRDERSRGTDSSPHITLSSTSEEAQHEAQRWLRQLLFKSSEPVSVCNNFILHLGEKEQTQLRQIVSRGVIVEESFDRGQATITVLGSLPEDVAVVVLQVEAMLCNAVDEFVRQEKRRLSMSAMGLDFKRKAISPADPEYPDAVKALRQMGQETVKVESVWNAAMKKSFDCLQHQFALAPRKMFQCVPAHFCDVVCQVGFNAECAPPDDPQYGEGIYFASTVEKALEVWKLPNQEYVYIVEAEVLTGNSTPGQCGLIVPPVLDPAKRYDSVSGGPDISVIFNSRQALPTKIIICKMLRP